jgi:hypothetical protein
MEPYETLLFEDQRRAIIDRNKDLQVKEMEAEFKKIHDALQTRFEYYLKHHPVQLRKLINIRRNLLPNAFSIEEVNSLESQYNSAVQVLKADMRDPKDSEPMYKVQIWPPPKRWIREIESEWLLKWGVTKTTCTMTNVYVVATTRTSDPLPILAPDIFETIDILVWRTIIETAGAWKQMHNLVF